MLFSLIKGIKKRKIIFVLFAFSMGISSGAVSAFIASLLNVKEKIAKELKAFGSNINVVPKEGKLLYEDDVFKIKKSSGGTIFWRCLQN